jgi:hypothetical protein
MDQLGPFLRRIETECLGRVVLELFELVEVP